MELTFEKIDGQWVAEFEATSDFNINLDRVGKGALAIYQKGSKDGTYASKESYRNTKDSENIDADITALVYPKYIKVVSQTEVVKGIVTMDGEGGGGTSGGLRPITADDVTLEIVDGMSGQATPISFATSIFLEQRQNLVVRYEKEIFVGTKSIFTGGDALNSSSMIYYNMTTPQEVKLDLYIKD